MTEDEMRKGFLAGRRLIQEDWSTREEIATLDRLFAEGVCAVSPWQYVAQLECMARIAIGVIKDEANDNARTS